MKNFRRMLMISIVVALGTAFSLDYFMEGFIITLSIILLPLLLYAYEPLEPMPTCLVVALVSPGFRLALTYYDTHDLYRSFLIEAPSCMFYVVYGIVYTVLYWESGRRNVSRLVMTVLLADFLSNMVEVGIRSGIDGFDFQMAKELFIIALVRSTIVTCGLVALKYYRSFLSREEHEARYRRLMMLMSSFKSEIYFMNMNMKYIESIMGKSFRAYKIAEEIGTTEELRMLTLDISKDVHEIKKDYIRVIKGLEDMSEARMELKAMSLRDLVKLLIDSLKETDAPLLQTAEITAVIEVDVKVEEHFYLMSVLRNLMVNALEASAGKAAPRVTLAAAESEGMVTVSVKDNGTGIRSSDLGYIFNPGFSTKYDPESGDMNRGLGLTLVRELVENHFKGTISVDSVSDAYTAFKVSIPKMRLEERPL